MTEFFPLSDEALRVAANLAQRHDAYVVAVRIADALPSSMYFAKKDEREYLVLKRHSGDSGTTVGARSAKTEAALAKYLADRETARTTLQATERALAEIINQYRALKLPLATAKAARILRELDIVGMLGEDLMLVGTNAFPAYQMEAGCRFQGLLDETDDFDLAWCRGSGISLAARAANERAPSLLGVLKQIDPQYRINKARPYQALASDGYEVELLVAPSLFSTLPRGDAFSPMAIFQEQEWLLRGRPIRHVLVSRDAKTCPIFAPDPRWMALHKMWLANKPERNANKRDKDRSQGEILLDAVKDRMQIAYPLNIDFVLELPEELRTYFDAWASSRQFIPGQSGLPTFR